MRLLTFCAVLLAVCVVQPTAVDAFQCGCFRSEYQSDLLAIMCSDSSTSFPGSITGWGRALNEWFVVDCKFCGTFNCTRGEEPERVEARYTEFLENLQEQQTAQKLRRPTEMEAAQDDEEAPADLYPCCCYAKKEYYYTEGIHCDALNPSWRDYCVEEEYGAQLIGQWQVEDLENQCYFITGTNGTRTGRD